MITVQLCPNMSNEFDGNNRLGDNNGKYECRRMMDLLDTDDPQGFPYPFVNARS